MPRRPVLRNIIILASSGLCERFLGALYRVLLARAAGAVALGLIQFCLPILRLAVILGTLGLPQTLTRAVADAHARKQDDEARVILVYAFRAVATAAGMISLALVAMAPLGPLVFPDARVTPLLRWLGPILFCDCLASILQADYQGRNRMWPVALAGIAGQGCKLAATLLLIGRASMRGAGAVASTAMAAIALSEMTALFLLLGLRGKAGAGKRTARWAVDRRGLFLSALPLMGDGLVFAVAGAIDMLVVPRRLLQLGLAGEQVTVLVGRLWGMAFPALFLPMVLIWPVTAATLPVMAAASARGDVEELRRRIVLTYAIVGGIAVLSMLAFLLGAEPLVLMLYACPDAAPYLRLLGWAVCPIYLASIGSSFLVALGQPALLFRQSLACAAIRTSLLYVLTGLPRLGVAGAILGIAMGNTALALANGWAVHRSLHRQHGAEK